MKKMTSKMLKLAAGIFLAVNISFTCMGQGVEIPNEYWIEPTTNGLDLGTLENPFYGNNQAAFDLVMSSLVTSGNVVVHLLAGTYETAGPYAYTIGPNTTIKGSSMDSTIVHFALANKSFQGVWQSPQGSDHITIQDLTIDCNGSNNILSFAIALRGNYETVKRVKAINAVGNQNESFGIALGYGCDSIVEDCLVTNCLGTYGNAFDVGGSNSCVINCRAYLPVGYWVGINCWAFHNMKIIGNHIDGGVTGVYMDTGVGDGILIEGNTFNGMNRAIQFNNGSPIANIDILGNVIHLGANVDIYPNHAIQFSGIGAQSVEISHNIIVGNNTGRGDDSLNLSRITGGIVANNILDNRLTVSMYKTTTNVWMFNNVDQYGNYASVYWYTNTWTPKGLPNPVMRKETATNYTTSLNDYFIGVTTNSATTITLQSAAYVGDGKTYVIQDESGDPAGITIAPQSGELINGASTMTITSPYKAITVISDGISQWYARWRGSYSRGGSCTPPPSGLIGWWPAEGNASDIIGGYNGVLNNGVTFTNGVVNQAFNFDGTNGFVQIHNASALNPDNLTIECWVKFNSLDSDVINAPAGTQYIVFKQNKRKSGVEGFSLEKDRTSNGIDYFGFEVTSTHGVNVVADDQSLQIQTNVWYHVAGVRGPNYIQLYINGQLVSQTSVGFPQSYGNHPLYFGTTGVYNWDGKFAGSLDEVSLYNRALSPNEIQAIYSAGYAGKCAP